VAPQILSNKILVFIEFWRLPDMLFDSFDCDYTQPLNHNEKNYQKQIVKVSNNKQGLRSIIQISIPDFQTFATCERITIHTTHLKAQQ
jgi:hypothetical protein